MLLEGETYRQGLALRHGLGEGWKYLLDISAVSHSGGIFDGFIERAGTASSVYPRVDLRVHRMTGWRSSMRMKGTGAAIDRSVIFLRDASFGLGYAPPHPPLANDGLALPAGDEGAPAGSGGFSASAWAETSGPIPGPEGSRRWL